MKTGFRGAFVFPWSQTTLDGLDGAPLSTLSIGSVCSWCGEMLRVDGPNSLLQLDHSEGAEEARLRSARIVKRLVGAAIEPASKDARPEAEGVLLHSGFVVTDGTQIFTITVISTGSGLQPLLMFVNEVPPYGTDLWVVDTRIETMAHDLREADEAAGVICFTPGTQIETPDGPRLVEELQEGDCVLTRDNGPQGILWKGARRMSGARMFVMPRLRPVRIRSGALGQERPEGDLLVSPDHQILVDGPAAYDLFNEREVLVAAKHLVNETTITIENGRRHVTYIHLLLPAHEILTANGVASESFHPSNADLDTLSPEDLTRLLALFPELKGDPKSYGDQARRTLNASEGAIIGHVA